MPCRSDDYPDYAYKKYQAEADTVTRLLCAVMRRLDDTAPGYTLLREVDGLAEWWSNHQRVDHERVQQSLIDHIRRMPLSDLEQLARDAGLEV